VQLHDLTLFADYYQFYLQDESADGNLSEAWSPEAVTRYLATGPGVVGVRTTSAAVVPVSIELWDTSPIEDFLAFWRVSECSLGIEGRSLVVAGCTEHLPDARRIAVLPGTYRVRVSFAGSEAEAPTQERYRVQLWPAPAVQPHVIK
jgi:hypothetical protein